MATLWLVNGRATGLDPADRGLAYGDGLFETMAARDGRIRWLDYHLERLADGCRRLYMPPLDSRSIREEIGAHCPPSGRHVVKLIVTRGVGARGYKPPERAEPTRILSISPWPSYPADHYTRGIRVRALQLRLGENPALAGLKHLCRLEQVLAQVELRDSGADEGILQDASGYIVGGISGNLFLVRGTQLTTPALTRCGVKGVMRRVVLEFAEQLKLTCVQRDLSTTECLEADELFMTNALLGVRPVTQWDDRLFPLGATTSRIMRLLGYGAHE